MQILAIEIARVHHGDVEVLLPRIFGEELVITKAPPQPSWPENVFLDRLDEQGPETAAAVRAFIREGRERGYLVANGTAQQPSLILARSLDNTTFVALSLFSGGPFAGTVRVWLDHLHDNALDAGRAVERLARIPGQDLDLDQLAAKNYRKWVHVPFALLRDPDVRVSVLDAVGTGQSSA